MLILDVSEHQNPTENRQAELEQSSIEREAYHSNVDVEFKENPGDDSDDQIHSSENQEKNWSIIIASSFAFCLGEINGADDAQGQVGREEESKYEAFQFRVRSIVELHFQKKKTKFSNKNGKFLKNAKFSKTVKKKPNFQTKIGNFQTNMVHFQKNAKFSKNKN